MRQRHAAQNKEPAADIAATVRMNVNSLGWSAGLGTPQWLHQLTHPADARMLKIKIKKHAADGAYHTQ